MKARKIVRNRRKMDEKGVSPVIGVILMVAATIVIAAVVMGMLGGFGPPKKLYAVTASASENATGYIYIVYNGGPDSYMVKYINISVDGTVIANISSPKVGSTTGHKGTPGPNNNHVVVSTTFKDDATQVILDTWV